MISKRNSEKQYNAFQLGVETGVQIMMNKMQKNFEAGKPVTANGELYWLTDSKQHLQDVMDSIRL
jgi:primase-polymerase (primpol)-like protein